MENIYIGQGFDIHKLKEGKKFIVGGIEIPYEKGIDAHSDGDVVIHAIIDAILGATGKGNIGLLFPDTDMKYKDIDSKILLKEVIDKIEKEFKLINVDITIICEQPKLSPHVPKMQEILSKYLNIPVNRISIKPKTAEKFGDIGKGNAISSICSLLLKET